MESAHPHWLVIQPHFAQLQHDCSNCVRSMYQTDYFAQCSSLGWEAHSRT